MAIAFLFEAAAVTLLVLTRHDALLFVLLSGLVFLGGGKFSHYSLPPLPTPSARSSQPQITDCSTSHRG